MESVAFGELLRLHRERLTPEEVGLSPGARRRTPGLRREEVAQLANVSVTYYTILEQGRPVQPSRQVLDALAAALHMTSAERSYLLTLAGPAGAGSAEEVGAHVADLVRRMEPYPTMVKGRRWDILAANDAAEELFRGWGGPAERNLVRWMFTCEEARDVYLEWEPEARAMMGRFRLATARVPDDQRVAGLVAELTRVSPCFRDWWPSRDVAAIGAPGTKKLRHPRLGPTEYSHVILQVADNPDHVLVTYTPSTGLAIGSPALEMAGLDEEEGRG